MASELAIYEQTQALIETKRANYIITSPITGAKCELKRNIDFAVIPKTKKPSLLKEGCEKICNAYGLIQRYSIETKIEETGDNPFFYYLVKCELVKLFEGNEIVFSTGYGSANTGEKRNGFNSAYDAANNAVKMAVKRSLSSATIAIAGLSGMFSMDMENETFMNGYTEILSTQDEDATITAKQVKRLYALGNEAGLNAAELKNKLAAMGITSTKDIKQSEYEEVCKKIGELNG